MHTNIVKCVRQNMDRKQYSLSKLIKSEKQNSSVVFLRSFSEEQLQPLAFFYVLSIEVLSTFVVPSMLWMSSEEATRLTYEI